MRRFLIILILLALAAGAAYSWLVTPPLEQEQIRIPVDRDQLLNN